MRIFHLNPETLRAIAAARATIGAPGVKPFKEGALPDKLRCGRNVNASARFPAADR
jgi:hypothetical protein